MKNILRYVLPVCISLGVVFTGCDRSASREINILQIDGVEWACNITTSFATFGSIIETEGKNEISMVASDGDLLYMLWDDLEFYYRYNHRDGQHLSVIFDTLDMVSVYLNGELNYVELMGPSIPAKFTELSKLEVSKLSTLYLNESLISDLLPVLEEKEIQGVGLVLSFGSASKELNKLLSLFKPEFLVLEDPKQLPAPNSDYALEGLELLWMQAYSSTLVKMAQCCGDLKSLILSGWEPKTGELLPLASMTDLENLTLAESDISSLQNIELPENLHSLNLINCAELKSISKVQDLTQLCRLNLTGCENVDQLEMLQDQTSLRWFSFPPLISQAEFKELTRIMPQLEVAELISCSKVQDLSPLQSMENLSVLALEMEPDQLAGLDSLKQLDLLIVTDELFDDNIEYINHLKASLPNGKVVPGSGLCLGSGWLMLLLPLIMLFRYSFRLKR